MMVKRSLKIRNGVKMFLISSFVTLTMIFIASGISCQSPETEPPPSTPPAESEPAETTAANEVTIINFTFVPDPMTVPVGTTVTWINKQTLPHTVISRDGLFNSGNLFHDDTFSYTFTEAGTFDYYCRIHADMEGQVIVE